MNNRIITTIYCAIITIAAMAQTETPDSVKTQELDEVVVEAQIQRTNATSSTYTPTTRQKSSAQNAIDLCDSSPFRKSTSILLTMLLRHQAVRMSRSISTISLPRQRKSRVL